MVYLRSAKVDGVVRQLFSVILSGFERLYTPFTEQARRSSGHRSTPREKGEKIGKKGGQVLLLLLAQFYWGK